MRRRRAAAPPSTTSTSTSARARSWASPASRATARPSWSTRSWACGRSPPARVAAGRRGHHRVEHPRPPRGRASGSSPRTGTGRACCWRRTLWENRILGHQTRPPAAKGWFIDRKAARADTERIMKDYDVRAPGPDTLAVALSGGNQQKLIVGREMSPDPRLLIAAHPTRGVDVGAQAAIWELLKDARAEGMGILLISADLDELIGLSDTLHGHAARPAGRHARPGDVHPRAARRPHDRRAHRGGCGMSVAPPPRAGAVRARPRRRRRASSSPRSSWPRCRSTRSRSSR